MKRRRQKKLSRRLFAAIMQSDVPRVRAALRAGADPHRPDTGGTTPLYEAAVSGRTQIVRLLLEAGVSPDAESRGVGAEGTPLCAAACWGDAETVRELLAHGADPNLREDDGAGRSPLEWANDGPHPETAALLTSAGALGPAVPFSPSLSPEP
ncbi:ankyrin repeat domain-containing protein [Streptomyces sp. WM6372]|uniref:ankyrin repeat domain-containing protein n=1 Tax=Streptomyces sp. WM6372 TaxID=1415555 RepID=UPI0006AE69AC|nr:ankyrin repeat domain-containing protein [Streptomyces sp. WM6372]